MKKQLLNLSILQSAKVVAALYLVASVPFVILYALGTLFFGGGGFLSSTLTIIIAPILYAVFGFIFTVVGAFVYNFVASMIGGIEYTSTDVR